MTVKEYVHFEISEEKPKTNVYQVLTNKKIIESGCLPHHILLGVIEWRASWRQYVFTPTLEVSTDWSLGCLAQITDFLRELKRNKKLVPKEFA